MTNQEFPESFTLELRARHFKRTHLMYMPLSRAIREALGFNVGILITGVMTHLRRRGSRKAMTGYSHEMFYDDEFHNDRQSAISHNFDDTIIRTIKMTRA